MRIGSFIGRHLGHQLIALSRQAFERFAEHGGGGVGFSGFKKADAAVVSIMNEPGKLLLAEGRLHIAVVAAGAEGEARDSHA
jgi:FAD synthase